MSKILGTSILIPDYHYPTEDIVAMATERWLNNLDDLTRRKALKIFKGSEISSRSSVVPLDIVFGDLSFEETNNIYKEKMIEMGTKVLSEALTKLDMQPDEIDCLITTSCTGFMIPSVDAYMVNNLNMRQDIIRLPVTEMGCAGGTSGLIYANQIIRSNPKLKVALVSVETPSLTFQKNDPSVENLVSTAIFADGASCAIIGESSKLAPRIVDTQMYHFKDGTHLMGFNLQNTGLKIVLDKDVPNAIKEHFPYILPPFLEKNGLTPQEINHYMFHPGGKKIINMVEKYIEQFDKDISDSKEVLNQYGNMSSSTILYILDRFLQKKNIAKGDRGYMLAFGPGFMAQNILLEWD